MCAVLADLPDEPATILTADATFALGHSKNITEHTEEIMNESSVTKTIAILTLAFVGWAICGAIMGIGDGKTKIARTTKTRTATTAGWRAIVSTFNSSAVVGVLQHFSHFAQS